MYSDELRPPIPEPMKRAVRQRYRFGCAVCGLPVFDYDHIEPFASVRTHTEENLILLCPNHHSAKTRNRLSEARLRHYQQNPFNTERAATSAYDIDKTETISIELGSNRLFWTPETEDGECHVVWISGQDHFLLHREDGWITFSMLLTDESGGVLLDIDHGQMRVATHSWDYEYVGSRLKIREALRSLVVDLELANDHVTLHTACFVSGGMGWRIADGWMHSIGTKGMMASFMDTAHLSGSGGGMYGMTNVAVCRYLYLPGFCWHVEANLPQPGYIWFATESLELFRQGEIRLKSLQHHWRDQTLPQQLSSDLAAVSEGQYFLELTTNERLSGPIDSQCLVVPEIKAIFTAIALATSDPAAVRAETVAYVPAELLEEHRKAPYGVFVEPDSKKHERCVRLVVHVAGYDEPRLSIKSEEIVRMLMRGQSNAQG